MKKLLDSRNRGSQSPPPPIVHTASLAPGGGHIHEPPPQGEVPRQPRALAPPSPCKARGGPVSRKSKLKPLHWNKVTTAVQGTLWMNYREMKRAKEIDIAEFEELFKDVTPKIVDSKEAKKICPENVQLIDPSRANSVEMMLTKVKMPLSNMTHAILAMDDKILSVDQLESILKWIPTREDMVKLKNYIIDTDMRMSQCEKYFVELMKVPRMESKVMIFLFKVQFNTQLAKFKRNLNTVHSACHEVQSSIKLMQIVKEILYYGNTLNLKSPKGAEVGFKLDTVLKLVNKQALDGHITLNHCLCKVLASKSPALLDFHEDLVNLEAASKITTKNLGDEMHVILNGLNKAKQELDTSESEGSISDYFRMRLKEFIGFAEPEVTSVTEFYQVVGRETCTLALHLGEDPATCPFEQATLKLLNFVKLFRKCIEENSEQAEGVMNPAHGSLELPRGAPPPPPPPPPRGASTGFGAPCLVVRPSPPPPPPPTRPLCAPKREFKIPLGDDPGRGHAGASRPPPPPPVPKVPPPPSPTWTVSLNTYGGPLGGYPGRGYEPGPPGQLPHPPGGLGRGHRDGGPAVRNSNQRPIVWFKVTRAVKGSLWEDIQKAGEGQSSPPEFDHSELEAYFSNAPKKVVSKEADKKKAVSSKRERVELIDTRRANNTLIMLTKVKMEYSEIVEAILAMNEELLDADQLKNILKFCPTKEEIEHLQNYQGDKDKLGKCELYFMELIKVPRMESKVNCFLFKIQFNTQLEKFKKSLNTINSACDEVRKSIKLRDVLKRILYLADTVSQGTARGAEAGFNLDSLMKLVDTQSSISRMNLMHYVCKVFASKEPALLDFSEDLVSLEAATKIKLNDLKEMHGTFHDGLLQKAKHELDASANDGPISQGFCMGLKELISFAEPEVTTVTDLYTVVRRKAKGLAIYIGADPAHCPFEQAIQTLHNFVQLYQKCHEDKQEHEDKENKGKQAVQLSKPYNGLLEVPIASKNLEINSSVAPSCPPTSPPLTIKSGSLSPPTLIRGTLAPPAPSLSSASKTPPTDGRQSHPPSNINSESLTPPNLITRTTAPPAPPPPPSSSGAKTPPRDERQSPQHSNMNHHLRRPMH